jgi:hypothetical protein
MAEKITPAQELEQLQLEETRYKIRDLRNAEDTRRTRARAVESSLRSDGERTAIMQAQCVHRKGGKGVEMIYRGNDSNYAVIKHQLPHGPIIVICQRCIKLWTPPDPVLNAKGATVEMRRLYAKQLKEYHEALNYPTDNEMSGSQLFVITRNEPLAEAV